MLAGLLFATHEAEGRPGVLAATLPFAAGTLIEYQARLLIAAGASQIVVVVARLTPELIGALARIGKRGIAVDAVRSAADAQTKLHPLARLVMMADGLVTTESVVAAAAMEGDDAILVLPEGAVSTTFERIGGGAAWAGVARLAGRRIVEAAAMPADYDLQSTLLHVAGQAGAARVELPMADVAQGHGIERRGDLLEARGRAVLAASLAARRSWFDLYIAGPIARVLMPALARRHVASGAVAATGALTGLAGLVSIRLGWGGAGLVVSLVASIVLTLAAALASFREEAGIARASDLGVAAVPALAALTVALGQGATAIVLALAAIVAGAIGERAVRPSHRWRWWSTPPAALTLVAIATLAGVPVIGLGIAAGYTAATLAAAVEALRRDA